MSGFRNPRHSEDGFTLIEAIVALVIIFGLLVVLLRTFDSSTRVLVETRRQATAVRLASQLVERAQALEWQHMGLATSKNGNDCVTEQVGCYAGTVFADLAPDGLGSFTFEGETMVFSNADTFAPFIDFHSLENRDGTDYDRYLFVTSIVNPVTMEETARRLIAVVQWVPPNGFRREVRVDTLVSEYREPSQPLISGTVHYDAGKLEFRHRDPSLADGSALYGTQWWDFEPLPDADADGEPEWPLMDVLNQANQRETLNGLVLFPTVNLEGVSDFVSGTATQYQGTNLGALAWNGVQVPVPDPYADFLFSDDDASSLPPLNRGLVFNTPVEGYHYTRPYPQDLVVAELDGSAALADVAVDPLDKTNIDGSVLDLELWTQLLNGLPNEDELPYVTFDNANNGSPDKISVGVREYQDGVGESHFMYTTFGAALELNEYEFMFYERGDGSAVLDVSAFIDRNNSVIGERTIEGEIVVAADEIRLLDDDAYSGNSKGKNARFEGWVKVVTPSITVADVISGQGVVAAPTLSTPTDLIIYEWDPTLGTAGDYVEIHRVDYSTLGSACSAPETVTAVPLFGGGVMFEQIRQLGNPWLDYQISGELLIRPWCSTVETDALGNVSRSLIQTYGPIVSGEIDYKVTDVYWRDGNTTYTWTESGIPVTGPLVPSWTIFAPGELTLFDMVVYFETDSLAVATVYEDPNAG